MKASSKLKIVATILTIIGVALIVIGISNPICLNCSSGWESHKEAFGESTAPNFALIMPGILAIFISIPVWVTALKPQITKMGAELHNETMDVAGEEIKEAVDKTIDVAEPGVKRVVKSVAGTLKEGVKGNIEEELAKAQKLYDDGLISEEEYEALRKKILGI